MAADPVWSYISSNCPHCREKVILVQLLVPGNYEVTCNKCRKDYAVTLDPVHLHEISSVCPICQREIFYVAPARNLTFYVTRSGPMNLITKLELHPCEMKKAVELLN